MVRAATCTNANRRIISRWSFRHESVFPEKPRARRLARVAETLEQLLVLPRRLLLCVQKPPPPPRRDRVFRQFWVPHVDVPAASLCQVFRRDQSVAAVVPRAAQHDDCTMRRILRVLLLLLSTHDVARDVVVDNVRDGQSGEFHQLLDGPPVRFVTFFARRRRHQRGVDARRRLGVQVPHHRMMQSAKMRFWCWCSHGPS